MTEDFYTFDCLIISKLFVFVYLLMYLFLILYSFSRKYFIYIDRFSRMETVQIDVLMQFSNLNITEKYIRTQLLKIITFDVN